MAAQLPAFAPFPSADLRSQIPPDDWIVCLHSWIALIDGHLTLPDASFAQKSVKDESLAVFLSLFVEETARGGIDVLGSSPVARKLLKDSFTLVCLLGTGDKKCTDCSGRHQGCSTRTLRQVTLPHGNSLQISAICMARRKPVLCSRQSQRHVSSSWRLLCRA